MWDDAQPPLFAHGAHQQRPVGIPRRVGFGIVVDGDLEHTIVRQRSVNHPAKVLIEHAARHASRVQTGADERGDVAAVEAVARVVVRRKLRSVVELIRREREPARTLPEPGQSALYEQTRTDRAADAVALLSEARGRTVLSSSPTRAR